MNNEIVDPENTMPETNRKNNTPEVEEGPLSIGSFLKAEREKKGYTLEQVAGEIRLRQYLLEAIENENWQLLPAPVFVKGFIRAYARALGLNEEDVVNQYDCVGELKEPLPQPLTRPIRSRRVSIILLIVALAVIAATIIFWQRFKTQNRIPTTSDQAQETGVHKMTAGKGQSEEVTPSRLEATMEMGSIGDLETEEAEEEGKARAGNEEELDISQPAEPSIKSKPQTETVNTEQEKVYHILKARILEETYVRLTIDDKDPKEYIFQPGTRTRWEAENGFDVLIGNAAGIEFEFGDKLYQNLGRRGQVVRLRFPEAFTATITEE